MDYKAKAKAAQVHACGNAHQNCDCLDKQIEAALRESAATAYEDAARIVFNTKPPEDWAGYSGRYGGWLKGVHQFKDLLFATSQALRAPEVKTEERPCRCNANKTPCDSCEDAAYPQECVCETSGQPHGDGYSCPPAPPSPDEKSEQEK